jgi:glycine/D-amino acid oxidase-like deaminating enzyme
MMGRRGSREVGCALTRRTSGQRGQKQSGSSDRHSAPAVVMGLTVTGLAVARALGRRGIEVVAVHSGPVPAMARSRYLRPVRGPGNDDAGKLLDFYLELARSLGRGAVLLPTGVRNVRFLEQHQDQLRGVLFFPHLRHRVAAGHLLQAGAGGGRGAPRPPAAADDRP